MRINENMKRDYDVIGVKKDGEVVVEYTTLALDNVYESKDALNRAVKAKDPNARIFVMDMING
jgi:hypothetical protein